MFPTELEIKWKVDAVGAMVYNVEAEFTTLKEKSR